MLQEEQVAAVCALEDAQRWGEAFQLYQSNGCSSGAMAIRTVFFCWYFIWQWDEIDFPDEHYSIEEKGFTDRRGGLSLSALTQMISPMAHQIASGEIGASPEEQMILVHMQRIYPYFFDASLFSDQDAQRLFRLLNRNRESSRVVSALCSYRRNWRWQCTETAARGLREYFCHGGLMDDYFLWLFRLKEYDDETDD